MNLIAPPRPPVHYPDSDGKPMADNTKQARWIVVLFGNLAALFRHRADVFVAMDHLWYPVEGEPDIRAAPDVYVVFGRPKGDRGSYKQWEEADVPLTVVFEILSPGNTALEMDDKLMFYDEYGVEEYYLYDPDANRLKARRRGTATLAPVYDLGTYVSPRLGIRFDLSGPEMVVRGPDGKPFLSFEELTAARQEAEARANLSEARANLSEARAARLVVLGRKARLHQATAEELAELDRLEADIAGP